GQVFIFRFKGSEAQELINSFNLKSKINCLKFNDVKEELLIGTELGKFYVLQGYTQKRRSVALIESVTKDAIIALELLSMHKSYYVTATENRITIWQLNEEKSAKVLESVFDIKTDKVYALATTNNNEHGQLLATGTSKITEIFEVVLSRRGTPQLVPKVNVGINYNTRQYAYSSNAVTALTFNKDGSQLATAYVNGNIELWQVKDFSQIESYFGHTSLVHSLIYTGHNNRLISGGEDQTIRIWDAQNKENALMLKNESAVSQIQYIDSLDKILSLRNELFIRFWPTNSLQLVEALCQKTNANEYLPLEEVYKYAGIEFMYDSDNCVYSQ
ncbi:MAG: hypothetical protein F6K30_31375, partial [Cyanothece sp. SIO2G6]|nr:hypothetical protein [Cyanothece sp. SIO2G6]